MLKNNLILISSPGFLPEEDKVVNALFEEGLETFHLRKPGANKEELVEFLKKLKPSCLKRVVVHQEYSLLEKFNLKGIHLKEQYYKGLEKDQLKELLSTCKKKNLQISVSLHDTDDLPDLSNKFSYAFLSPVFESISKSGYASSIELKVPENLKTDVIALGGINENTVERLSGKGFAGAAILGAVWESFKESSDTKGAVKIFQGIKEKSLNVKWKKDLIY